MWIQRVDPDAGFPNGYYEARVAVLSWEFEDGKPLPRVRTRDR